MGLLPLREKVVTTRDGQVFKARTWRELYIKMTDAGIVEPILPLRRK